ncbi:nitronate monooxygenase [Metabacillus sp. GX 13764]|uniref:NAD(P)H-dependent flavin oxidoreductase n=1 Tax=Metabacillus kandeliae TaxID=2900151 RepID=UPI001E5AB887|nr:nitronate monooxygenase [Metabacillus kandeliae]MCD7036471.1 nitronate monooxygenase [Metabacillus kandeliae]
MNELCRILGIQVPILQGGMGNISNAALTAAVSEEGALGTIGAGTMTPEEVEKIILETKERTENPFALNIALAVSPFSKELMQLAVKHGLKAVSLSAGNPAPFIPYFKENGVKVITVTAAVKHAVKAAEGGSDIIVGEGYEAAGLNSPLETTTLALIPQLADAVNVPVAAAGGIADGRGLAAMLALGAQGVQMGTRFIATKEAPFSELYKERLLLSDDTGTAVIGRSVGRIRRVLKNNAYTAQLLQQEKAGLSLDEFTNRTDEKHHILGAVEGNEQEGYWNSGQIAGLIHHIPTVAELIHSIKLEMTETIGRLEPYMKKEVQP